MCLIRAFEALDRYLSARRTDRGMITRKYLLGEYCDYDEGMTHVPEGCIYVEEWAKGDRVRRRIVYELEEITPYIGNAFDKIRRPWSWIGDASTDVDITSAIEPYLIPGNDIRLDLLLLFLRPHTLMQIRYANPASGEERLFPNSGISIGTYGPS
jgi:hypothetical protein